jgi:beta-aspartyl-peptidase (threonine type)
LREIRIMRAITSLILLCIVTSVQGQTTKNQKSKPDFVLVIHGGAGSATRETMSREKEQQYIKSMDAALTAGYKILEGGGTALDAVETAIRMMEDDSLYNAGRGAVLTNEGKNELDASIMEGSQLKAGAVAGVTTIKNPITAARAVMEKSKHVMMAGRGAEEFAASAGCTVVDPSYFFTKHQLKVLQKAKTEDSLKDLQQKKTLLKQIENKDGKYGTVGAVALDKHGNLAAGTSTGGMTNKRYGRIGDSPIIGAGTYADNNTCAVSCTGWGEYFIRLGMAKSVSDRMELKGMKLNDAAREMIHKKLTGMEAEGGLIGVDRKGNITMQFNTSAMNRGYIKSDGEKEILIYRD